MNEIDLRESLSSLFDSQQFAVLSTNDQEHPYSNLLAFHVSTDLKHLHFATKRATRKYGNLTRDGKVSFLIDNRSDTVADLKKTMAVTATGTAIELEEERRAELRKPFLEKHPYLEEFLSDPDCAMFEVEVDTYYAVSQLRNVVKLSMK